MKPSCVVLVSNRLYLPKALSTINQLFNPGAYAGDVVLVVGDDLRGIDVGPSVTVIPFPDIDRSAQLAELKARNISDAAFAHKPFQYHKLHLFDTFFKQWEKVLYIDAGMSIFKPIEKILSLDCRDHLLAHSDAYPFYKWNLRVQFDPKFTELTADLESKYDMGVDYFQSSIMLYDTAIIENSTKTRLLELANKYINSRTTDQGILNLLFNCERRIWKQIQIKDAETHYYDFMERDGLETKDYIMLKYLRENIKW